MIPDVGLAQLAKLPVHVTLARTAVMWDCDSAGAPTWLTHAAAGWELDQGASLILCVSSLGGLGFSQHGSWF